MSDRMEKLRQAMADDDQRSAAYIASQQLDPDDRESPAAQFQTFLATELMPQLQLVAGEFAAAGRGFHVSRLSTGPTSQTLVLTLDRPGQDRAPLRLHLHTAMNPDGEVTAELERIQGTESEGRTAITPSTGDGIAAFLVDTYILALTRPDE